MSSCDVALSQVLLSPVLKCHVQRIAVYKPNGIRLRARASSEEFERKLDLFLAV